MPKIRAYYFEKRVTHQKDTVVLAANGKLAKKVLAKKHKIPLCWVKEWWCLNKAVLLK